MQTLKTLVVLLGIGIVIGFGLLIFGLTQNWHRVTETAPRSAPGWGRVDLNLPVDSVRSVTAASERVLVHVKDGNGERVLVLDAATGARLGTFVLSGSP
jgi:hypothetical protein